MSGHAPYIMPDGRSLAAVLRAEGTAQPNSAKKSKGKSRPKDEMWGQLQLNKRTALSDAELAEIRAIERVGHRRRRQWLNDKLLRDLAGPLTTYDMESQFKPVPFGVVQPPSAFTLAAAPEHAGLWDHFRSIDSDKEARVLQAWEAHNRQQQQHHHHVPGRLHVGGAAGQQQQQQQQACPQQAAAAEALARWSRVERRSRAALKKASVHTVLALELQALALLEQGDPHAELLLDMPDSFARLLMHGLAQFHNLLSTTTTLDGGNKSVLLQRKAGAHTHTTTPTTTTSSSPQQQQQQQQGDTPLAPPQEQQQQQPSATTEGSGPGAVGVTAGPGADVAAAAAGPGGASGGAAAEWLLHAPDITCTDVVMALRELGDTLNHHSLGQYIQSVHGSCAGSVRQEEV